MARLVTETEQVQQPEPPPTATPMPVQSIPPQDPPPPLDPVLETLREMNTTLARLSAKLETPAPAVVVNPPAPNAPASGTGAPDDESPENGGPNAPAQPVTTDQPPPQTQPEQPTRQRRGFFKTLLLGENHQ